MEIIRNGPVPPYRQVAVWLRDRIIAGEFGPDQRLPVETEIEQECGVARTTARRAVKVLRDEGWAYTVQSRGTFVSRDRPAPPADER